MTRLVVPQTLRGFRDVLPDEMFVQNEVVTKIRHVYESYGYLPIDTPILERLPTLVGTGGEETDKLIFLLESREDQRIGMRFDLTVPFARVIAQYTPNEIRLPFRRYHIGPVFRADQPQPEQGRFRQFTQFDIDIAGTDSVAADAEIVAVMSDAMQAVGLADRAAAGEKAVYHIRVSNRRLADAFLAGIGIVEPARAKHVMRVIDKRDKLSEQQLLDELGAGRTDESGASIAGAGLDTSLVDSVIEFVGTSGTTRRAVLAMLDKLIRPSGRKDAALAEVSQLLDHLDALAVSEAAARLDPSLTRGLDYYTGSVFECALPFAGVGSVMGGGRYDGLVSRFRDEAVPATGASIGLDRLVTGLRNVGCGVSFSQERARVIVLVMPNVPEAEASRLAAELRSAGVATELYVGDAMGKVGRQLAYANARELAVAVLLGEEELRAGTVTVKNLREGEAARKDIVDNEEYRLAGSTGQQTVARGDLVAAVRDLTVRVA